MGRKIAQGRLELLVDLIWVAFAGWYVISAQTYPSAARFVPTVFGGVALVVGLVQLSGNFIPALRGLTKGSAEGPDAVANVEREEQRRQLRAIAWALGFFAGILLLGFMIAMPLFMFVYFLILDRKKWRIGVISAVAMGILAYLVNIFSVPLPSGLIFKLFGM